MTKTWRPNERPRLSIRGFLNGEKCLAENETVEHKWHKASDPKNVGQNYKKNAEQKHRGDKIGGKMTEMAEKITMDVIKHGGKNDENGWNEQKHCDLSDKDDNEQKMVTKKVEDKLTKNEQRSGAKVGGKMTELA